MKIATFNVNSLRKRLPIVLEWLDRHKPDVLWPSGNQGSG